MFFRKSKLIQKLRAEIQYLRELLARTEGERDQAQQGFIGMKEVAAKALEAAKERHFPKGDIYVDGKWMGKGDINLESLKGTPVDLSKYLSDYQSPEAKNCPECSVSVRADSWPQECPACHSVFGFGET